jgi:hypothetical protein
MSFIALNKLEHEAYNMSASQVDLKLTDFTMLDAHTLPTHVTAWTGCVWSSFNVYVPHHH